MAVKLGQQASVLEQKAALQQRQCRRHLMPLPVIGLNSAHATPLSGPGHGTAPRTPSHPAHPQLTHTFAAPVLRYRIAASALAAAWQRASLSHSMGCLQRD